MDEATSGQITVQGFSSGSTVTVNNGGTLAPGASIDTLTIGGALTFNSGAVADMELGDGLTADKASASGTVTYNGTLKLEWTGTTLNSGDTFTLFDGSDFSGAFTGLGTPVK